MMQSNQPYQRVDDGIGAGLVGGASIGAAYMGASHYRSKNGPGLLRQAAENQGGNADPLGEMLNASADKKEARYKKRFGSGKRMAASYGISVLAGAAVGGIGDAII